MSWRVLFPSPRTIKSTHRAVGQGASGWPTISVAVIVSVHTVNRRSNHVNDAPSASSSSMAFGPNPPKILGGVNNQHDEVKGAAEMVNEQLGGAATHHKLRADGDHAELVAGRRKRASHLLLAPLARLCSKKDNWLIGVRGHPAPGLSWLANDRCRSPSRSLLPHCPAHRG